MTTYPYGFRVVGAIRGRRCLIDHATAFAAYAACDDRAELHKQSYLSAFQFGPNFCDLLKETGSCKGYSGPCWSAWLWFDVDNGDLDMALKEARRLALNLEDRFRLDDGNLLLFFSGKKGFHVGLPTGLWSPAPSLVFNRVARRFAEMIATAAKVRIDTGVYDKARCFRAPNSRHPATGLHKRRFTLDELTGLRLDVILSLAKEPCPFDLPIVRGTNARAARDWCKAERDVRQTEEAQVTHPAAGPDAPTLNRSTLDFIREGAPEGERAKRLFCAASNLGEFGCPPALAHALLREASLDSGLSPSEARRQINCGLQNANRGDGKRS